MFAAAASLHNPSRYCRAASCQTKRGSLGHAIIIENVSAADGSIGTGRAARAKADGHTIAWRLKEVKGDATVLEASSCSQAMQLIAENINLDLILLDLNLPDRDGFSVLTELGERYPAVSVVVLPAYDGKGEGEGVKAGTGRISEGGEAQSSPREKAPISR
jgi:CheY-like chemotaxis protein